MKNLFKQMLETSHTMEMKEKSGEKFKKTVSRLIMKIVEETVKPLEQKKYHYLTLINLILFTYPQVLCLMIYWIGR